MTVAVAQVSAYIATLESPPSATTLSGDVVRGKQLFSSCAACHGANALGNEALHAPQLAEQQDWYVAAQLRNFRSGKRGADPRDTFGRQMAPVARALPGDQAVIDVAAYIASLR